MNSIGIHPTSCILTTLLLAAVASTSGAADPPRSRHEFAKAISELKKGMPQVQVVRLLGRPDDVRTELDPGGISTVDTKEIWRYGTSGHLTTATLGQVYIDKNESVQYVFGRGTPPPVGMFKERDLRILLETLGQVPSYNAAWNYNPRKVIRAVNLLQPLGKEKALAAIEEFLRVASDWHGDGREGVFLVLRALFEVPIDPGYMPVMRVGAPISSEPKDRTLLPRFPIVIEGDIPFLFVEGFDLGGYPEQPESHVACFRKSGEIRARPLAPSDNPFQELDRFAKSPRWIYSEPDGLHDDQRGRQLLGQQVLRLIDTTYRVEPGLTGMLLPFGENNAARRNRIIQKVSSLEIHWDASVQKYVFSDGTSLPERELKHYRREIWSPMVAGRDVELIMERDGPRHVSVWVVENYGTGGAAQALVLRLFEVNAKDKTLVRFVVKKVSAGRTGTRSTGKRFELDEGGEVQVESIVDQKRLLSPTFKP